MMSGDRAAGRVDWQGASLTLSVPDRRWLDRIDDLLGLGAAATVDGTSDIRVHDGQRLRSFDTDVEFDTQADLLVWLALTTVDVLAEKAHAVLLHAAALRLGDGFVLLSGPPFAGKSTIALRAKAAGVGLAGDDVVLVCPRTLRASPVPRPIRERVSRNEARAGTSDPLSIGTPLAGMLDGEGCRLHPRGSDPAVVSDADLPIVAVYFLRRHAGSGLRFAVPEPFEAITSLLDHARAWGPAPLPALARLAALAKGCPCTILSVGDDEADAALLALVERHGSGEPP